MTGAPLIRCVYYAAPNRVWLPMGVIKGIHGDGDTFPLSRKGRARVGLRVGFRVLGEGRAGDALQVDVYAVVEVLEALGQVGQPRAGGVQVGGVDLCQVAQTDHLGAVAGAGDDGLDLVRGEVLALVDQDEALLETAPADVVQ